jgi:hypothetical protein
MGQPDLYPFVLAPAVIGKLNFVHARVHRAMGRDMLAGNEAQVLKSIAVGLRNRVAAPPRG